MVDWAEERVVLQPASERERTEFVGRVRIGPSESERPRRDDILRKREIRWTRWAGALISTTVVLSPNQ